MRNIICISKLEIVKKGNQKIIESSINLTSPQWGLWPVTPSPISCIVVFPKMIAPCFLKEWTANESLSAGFFPNTFVPAYF